MGDNKNIMSTKEKLTIFNYIFAGLFVGLLILPFLMLDTTEGLVSEVENRAMTAWPGWHFDAATTEWYGHYVEDRVGLRNQAITCNNEVTYKVFGEFSEDLHAFGKEGYIFPADEGYVKNYQHIKVNDYLVEDLTAYAKGATEYAKDYDATFVLMIAPNKSSVYADYMPDDILVDESRVGTLALAKSLLAEANVSYVIPDEELSAIAKEEQIYNITYDCAHWNDLGAFYALRMVDEKIAESNSAVLPMELSDYSQSTQVKDLDFFTGEITEEVPVLTPIYHATSDGPGVVDVSVMPGNNMAYFYNENASSNQTILILHDSFLDNKEGWYYGRYQQVYYTSRVNYTNLKEYIDVIHPDVILFEVAERAFADDLGAYVELGNYFDE